MSKFWKYLLAGASAVIILLIFLFAFAFMVPFFIVRFYNLIPQGPLCNTNSYLISWATNGIYVLILIVAVFAGFLAYCQLVSIHSQQETESIFTIYNYLYDEKFKLGKKKVYENEEKLKDKTKIKDFIPEIDTLLLLYNNISLLILNNKIRKSSLPIMFYVNAVKMSELCCYYIEFRQEKDPTYGKNYAKHFLELIPVGKKYLDTIT